MQNFSLSYPRYALRFIELKTRPLTQVEGGFFVLLEKKQAAIPTFFAPVHVEPFQPKGEKRAERTDAFSLAEHTPYEGKV